MNPQSFIPLLTVSHGYLGDAMQDLTAFAWSGNVEQLRRLTPRLTAAHGSVGLLLNHDTSFGPTLKELCASLRALPIFGWEMIPSSPDFAAYTDWPFRLLQEHPLLKLPKTWSPMRDVSSAPAWPSSPLQWKAWQLQHGGNHLTPVGDNEVKPSTAMAEAWGNTQEKILIRGRPSFSAFMTGADLAHLIEVVITPGLMPPRVPEAHWPAARTHWAYHISGYKNPPELTIDTAHPFPSDPAAFVDLATDLPAGTRSFISREPQTFFHRQAKAFRLRANGRDLIDALPEPSPRPFRNESKEQHVSDIFIHL